MCLYTEISLLMLCQRKNAHELQTSMKVSEIENISEHI